MHKKGRVCVLLSILNHDIQPVYTSRLPLIQTSISFNMAQNAWSFFCKECSFLTLNNIICNCFDVEYRNTFLKEKTRFRLQVIIIKELEGMIWLSVDPGFA